MQYSKPPLGPSSSSSITSLTDARHWRLKGQEHHPAHLERNELPHVAGKRKLKVLSRRVQVNNVHCATHAFAVRVQLLTVRRLKVQKEVVLALRTADAKVASRVSTRLAAAGRADHELRVATHNRVARVQRPTRKRARPPSLP